MKEKVLEKLKKIFLSNIFFYLLLTILIVLIFLYDYIYHNFSNITIDQLLYSLKESEGTSNEVLLTGFKYVMLRTTIFYVLYIAALSVIHRLIKVKTYIVARIKNKKVRFSLYPFSRITRFLFLIIIMLLTVMYMLNDSGILKKVLVGKSKFIEQNYVDPKKAIIKAPKKKRNLIHIYVESLEASFVSSKNGGAFNESVIPNLEQLALDNTNFSQNDKVGGAYMPFGGSWTIAGMVSQTAGVPLKVLSGVGNKYMGYGGFLPGTYSLGDILKENGYHNYLSIGSSAYFGGRKEYFTYHGKYTLYDYDYAIKHKLIPKNYHVWWGFEDAKLFNFAKEQLEEISSLDEPFNYTLLTADTHFTDGYLDDSCEKHFADRYLNSYYCNDKKINDFINWIKEQDFYDNTTIIITGDHLTMQANMTDLMQIEDSKNYNRSIYNVFINSKVSTNNTKNRLFNSFDIYPTTLSSLGFTIKGDRLGLGTNLFSNKKTLIEKYDNEYISRELEKESKFYNDVLLKDTYKKMIIKKALSDEE